MEKDLRSALLVLGAEVPPVQEGEALLGSLTAPRRDLLLTRGLAESAAQSQELAIGDGSLDGRAVEAVVDCMYSGRLAARPARSSEESGIISSPWVTR